MTLQTRKPTGKPSWPILVLAGREGAGKTWAAIEASSSNLVGRTIYVGFGEDDPDEYSLIPGASFDIAVHDGTYAGLLETVRDAVAEPHGDKPTLIILDSGTRLWNVIGDNMQAIANRRAKGTRNAASGNYTISTDLWNVAADQWKDVMDALREHNGPVIITARLDPVTVMENGQPTKDKDWKVQAHKSLVFDATAVIEMRERGQYLITKVKSVRKQLDKPTLYPGFTVEGFYTSLGLAEGTGERAHATVMADKSGTEPARQNAPQAPAPVVEPEVDQAVLDEWLRVKALIDGCVTREDFRTLMESGVKSLAGEKIPGDSKGRRVGDYLNHVWSGLPAADAQTGEVKEPEPTTEWPTAKIPEAQVTEAGGEDEAPF